MSDYTERLNALTKGLEKPSKVRVEEFTKILIEMYNSEGNYDELVDWLLRTHYFVGKRFFETNKLNPTEAIGMLNAVENHPFLKKSVQGFLFNRLFVICQSFIVNNVDPAVAAQLAYDIVFYGRQKGKFSASLIKGFLDIITDEKERLIFASFPDHCKNTHDKKILMDFVSACEINVETKQKQDTKIIDKVPENSPAVTTSECNTPDSPALSSLNLPIIVDQLKAQIDRLLKTNEVIDTLRRQVRDRESEIQRINQELKNSKGESFSLRRDLESKQKEIDNCYERIEDLENRLKSVFEMDDSIRSQELMTLKKDVADAIRMEYLDYKDSDQTFNEDNFVANSASLERVFKFLIRFGFEIDK